MSLFDPRAGSAPNADASGRWPSACGPSAWRTSSARSTSSGPGKPLRVQIERTT